MFQGLSHIIRKELIHTLRDKRMRFMLFAVPIVQLTVFGFAAQFDVKNIRLGVDDRDHSSRSRAIVERFVSSGYFIHEGTVTCPAECDDALDRRSVDAVLVIPRGFDTDARRGRSARVQVLIDGSNSNSATIVQNYVDIIASGIAAETMSERRGSAPIAVRPAFLSPQLRVWYNEDLLAARFMVPAVFAMILLVITVLLTAVGLTRERELGTYEQLIVTPVTPEAIILGKTLPFALIGLVEVTLILIAAWLIFGITVKSSMLVFYVSTLVFLMTTLSLGLFISSFAASMQQAMMLAFFAIFPAILLSGMFFPIDNMPAVFRYLTLFNPFRFFVEIVRTLFLKDITMGFLLPRLSALLSFGLFLMTVAAVRFRKTIQ